MSSDAIVLYDISSRPPCKAWSLNTWRVRLILNYKNIPYRTQWLEYPEIKPTLQSCFNDPDIETYTVPTIALPSGGGHIMNSKDIARVLETKYPSPPLILESPLAKRATALQIEIWEAIEPIVLTHVHKRLLNEVNFPFWRETREPWLNDSAATKGISEQSDARWKTLEDAEDELYANDAAAMNGAWEKAGSAIDGMAALLRQDSSGPFLSGSEVSFSDFQWIGLLLFVRRIGEDQWEKMRASVKDFGPHDELLHAARPWTERDGH